MTLTDETIPETGPLSSAQCMTLCAGCQRCCTYVAVEVDAPDVPWMYDQYVWLLYHKGIWMYVEKGNKWFVQFETVCEKLGERGECRVHGSHPVLCKEYDARYEMPPPPVSPLLLARRPLPAPDKVAYRKTNGHPVKGGRKVPVG